jgi:hypothetical protein
MLAKAGMQMEPAASQARGTAAGTIRLRRGSLAVIVLLVAEYALGAYVNLYVSVPGADHGGGLGGALAHGPASLSVHAALGLLLGLAALGVAGQAVLTRWPALIAASGAGLLAMIFASVAGAGFTSTGDRSASLAMAVLTGVALLGYVANLYLLRPPTPRGRPGGPEEAAPRSRSCASQ